MLRLEFTKRKRYESDANGICLPIALRRGTGEIVILASVDTGAAHCLFERSYGEMLGFDIEAGESRVFAGATGYAEAFGYSVSTDTLGVEFESVVYFFANAGIRKNLLGRIGCLDRIRLGSVDYDQMLYLAPYDS